MNSSSHHGMRTTVWVRNSTAVRRACLTGLLCFQVLEIDNKLRWSDTSVSTRGCDHSTMISMLNCPA